MSAEHAEGYDKGYGEAAAPRDAEIAKLEEENAKLREKFKLCACQECGAVAWDLRIPSGEEFCRLCEARSERDDARESERHLRKKLQASEASNLAKDVRIPELEKAAAKLRDVYAAMRDTHGDLYPMPSAAEIEIVLKGIGTGSSPDAVIVCLASARKVVKAYEAHARAESECVNATDRDDALAEQANHIAGILASEVAFLEIKLDELPVSTKETLDKLK